MDLEVKVDHAKCLASGTCAALAPEYFDSGPDGKSLVRRDGDAAARGKLLGLTQDQSNQVREAAMFCPPEAISVWDADTGEQYFP